MKVAFPAEQFDCCGPAVFVSERAQRREQKVYRRAIRKSAVQDADAARLLRARRKRPGRR